MIMNGIKDFNAPQYVDIVPVSYTHLMIPEGDTAFSTRNFGEGVAQQAKMTATGAMGTVMR